MSTLSVDVVGTPPGIGTRRIVVPERLPAKCGLASALDAAEVGGGRDDSETSFRMLL